MVMLMLLVMIEPCQKEGWQFYFLFFHSSESVLINKLDILNIVLPGKLQGMNSMKAMKRLKGAGWLVNIHPNYLENIYQASIM